MPKIVDHAARRDAVGEAVWRLVDRGGLEAVNVRSIAREAGLSTGAVAHYFADRDELIAHAFALVGDRVAERMRRHDDARSMLLEALPLDRRRRLEAQIWFGFLGLALGRDDLRAELRRRYDEWCEILPADELIAIVDGIAVQGLVSGLSPAAQVALLDRLLERRPGRAARGGSRPRGSRSSRGA